MYQRLSQSATRAALYRKNSHHPPGAARAKGRFTAIHVPAAAHASLIPRSGSFPRKRPATNATTSSIGNTLAAAPSPRSTPDHASLRRRYASVPPVANAIASRSQFIVAYSASVGASTKYRTRLPAIRYRQSATTNAAIHIITELE